ncbi:nucleotidyltransferase family protein [Polaribacter cellanae]|uniref:Nucleotidyltransferase family protein n=1 Tax=Polaribacter cellanae TaxID=2818493 RepID=A0A975CV14_9FLAO|nr:nucleotidyltransferase family protein [Polaribacter cellanae]QTE24071.1 nucleotidyltransferase family protein [Polaribacter cellanae]
MVKIAVLILAGGFSSRMKTPKQLLKIGDNYLLELVLEKAFSIQKQHIFCVLGNNSEEIQEKIKFENCTIIVNKNPEKGLSSSIVSGVKYLQKNGLSFDGICVLLADQPAIEKSYLKAMYQLFEREKTKIIASNYGNKFGVPAIIPKKYFSTLLWIEGDKGAKEFINAKKNDVLCPKLSTNFIDIDTKEDFESYKKLISK